MTTCIYMVEQGYKKMFSGRLPCEYSFIVCTGKIALQYIYLAVGFIIFLCFNVIGGCR